MTRRRFIALVSLCVLVMLGLIVLGTGYFVTQSEYGQDQLTGWVQQHGGVVGAREGSRRPHQRKLPHGRDDRLGRAARRRGFTLCRDGEDPRRVRPARSRGPADPSHVGWMSSIPTWCSGSTATSPGTSSGCSSAPVPTKPKGPERGFGDFVVMDAVHVRGAQLRVTMPWHPDDTLHGAKRDSAVKFNLARKDHEVRRTREGFTQNYRWTNAYVALSHARIADPDSIGRLFLVDTVHTVETVPDFRWRNVSATVRVLGESVWVKAPHWDLPASTGQRRGKDRVGERPPCSLRRARVRRHGLAERRGVGVSDASAHGRRIDGARHQEREEPAATRLRDHARWTFAPSSRGSSAT